MSVTIIQGHFPLAHTHTHTHTHIVIHTLIHSQNKHETFSPCPTHTNETSYSFTAVTGNVHISLNHQPQPDLQLCWHHYGPIGCYGDK